MKLRRSDLPQPLPPGEVKGQRLSPRNEVDIAKFGRTMDAMSDELLWRFLTDAGPLTPQKE